MSSSSPACPTPTTKSPSPAKATSPRRTSGSSTRPRSACRGSRSRTSFSPRRRRSRRSSSSPEPRPASTRPPRKLRKGDLDGAISALQKVLEKSPQDPNALFYLGLGYVGKKMYAEAVGPLTRVTELNPAFPGAYFELGVCYRALGDPKKALESYDKNLAAGPRQRPRPLQLRPDPLRDEPGRRGARALRARPRHQARRRGAPGDGGEVLHPRREVPGRRSSAWRRPGPRRPTPRSSRSSTSSSATRRPSFGDSAKRSPSRDQILYPLEEQPPNPTLTALPLRRLCCSVMRPVGDFSGRLCWSRTSETSEPEGSGRQSNIPCAPYGGPVHSGSSLQRDWPQLGRDTSLEGAWQDGRRAPDALQVLPLLDEGGIELTR